MRELVKEFADLLFALGLFVNAVLALLTYLKATHVVKTIKEVEVATKKLEINTNSIKDELVKVTGESEHAKGVLVGRAQERDKDKC